MPTLKNSTFGHPLNWLLGITGLLFFLVLVYVVSHLLIPGKENIKLSRQEILDISNLMDPDSLADSLRFTKQREYVLHFIEANHHLATEDSLEMHHFFSTYQNKQAFLAVLGSYTLRTRSFFWLIGQTFLLEVIFWTLFGVIANLLYNVSEAIRVACETNPNDPDGGFNPNELPVHWAKLLYSPFMAIVICLSIDLLSTDGDISLAQLSSAQVVLAFILGFFSGRMIDLLNRIKDLILPLGNADANKPNTTNVAKFTAEGKIKIDTNTGIHSSNVDFTQAVVRAISLANNTVQSIGHPDIEGSYQLTDLEKGDYLLEAELRANDNLLRGSTTIHLDEKSLPTDIFISPNLS